MYNMQHAANQLHFSTEETNSLGQTFARIVDLSLFDVSSVDVGRWQRLDNETDRRKVTVKYGDGREAELNLFRSRS